MKTIEARQEPLDKLFEEIFSDEMRQSREEPRQDRTHDTKPTAGAYPEIADDILILKATLAKNGNKFKTLWDGVTLGYINKDTGKPDVSAADIALMNKLAFWTGGNPSQMERLFLRSGLGKRAKCIDRPDYISRTITTAISDAKEFYSPNGNGSEQRVDRSILDGLSEKIKDDPDIIYEPEYFQALTEIYNTDPKEWVRIKRSFSPVKFQSGILSKRSKKPKKTLLLSKHPL